MREETPKAVRITQLSQMGFNTPRFVLVPALLSVSECAFEKRVQVLLEAAVFDRQNFANLRTYKRLGDGEESWNSTHFTFVPLEEVWDRCLEMSSKGYQIMVDIEDPNNGIYAGAVQLKLTPEDDFVLDYCSKPEGGAMVRDAIISVTGALKGRQSSVFNDLPIELRKVIRRAISFKLPYRSVILEWSYLKKPAGVYTEDIIFWEFRNLTL